MSEQAKPIRQKQLKLYINPKFGSNQYKISPELQKYVDKIENKSLLRYGLSLFSSQFIFGQQYKQVLERIYKISLQKIGKSPNTMHKYGSGDVIPKQDFQKIKQIIQPYLNQVFYKSSFSTKQFILFTDFSVHYGNGYDSYLAEHVDDSDITINICLKNNNNFTGLRFNQVVDTLFSAKNCQIKPIYVQMNQGEILIHNGKQRHQVVKNSQIIGETKQNQRVNLILWLNIIKLAQQI